MNRQDQSLYAFTTELASDAAAPGGGGVAALLLAQGAALLSMVAELTVGKKAYAAYEEELQALLPLLKDKAHRALAMMDEDEAHFLPLSRCYGMPQKTEDERKAKEAAMEEALWVAMKTPWEVLDLAEELMDQGERLSVIGSKLMLSDVGVAAEAILSGAKSARWSLYINLKMVKDDVRRREKLESIDYRLEALEERYDALEAHLEQLLRPEE